MLIVVGSHGRNTGKTSVICGLIRALPDARWTAVKISGHEHALKTQRGAVLPDCAGAPGPASATRGSHAGEGARPTRPSGAPYELTRELDPNGRGDTSRYLQAGAEAAFWLRAAAGGLGDAINAIHRVIQASTNTLIESNRVLEFLRPDLYFFVVNEAAGEFKESALEYVARADAIIVVGASAFAGTAARRFGVLPPEYHSPELAAFIRERLCKGADFPGQPLRLRE